MGLLDFIAKRKRKTYEDHLNSIIIDEAYILEYADIISKQDVFEKEKEIENIPITNEDIRYRITSSKTKDEIERELKTKKDSGVLSYADFTFKTSISFSELLMKYLKERNMSEPDLYNACGITRQTYWTYVKF